MRTAISGRRGPTRPGLLLGAGLIALLLPAPALRAQDTPAPEAAAAEEDLLAEEDLDLLVAPVALYPDSLLTQILVAATYPLDVVKAARFAGDNADLEGSARTKAAEAEDWDPSLQVLAAGFPDTLMRMAEDLDWTEALGDAVLVQTDDVLDAVQRQRARALAVGNLESNAAQEVAVTDDAISVTPADPEVVYVPAYDPETTYSTRAAAPAVIDPGGSYSTTDMVTTGAIAFGSALLINEIFDDDDDWDDYWRGPPAIDWDDDALHPRPGINVDGDVNVDIDRNRLDRDRLDIDRDRFDRDRPEIDRPDRIGDGPLLDGDRDDGRWKPSEDRRDAARDRLERKAGNGGRAPGSAEDRLKARSERQGEGAAREKLAAAREKRKPGAAVKPDRSALRKPDGASGAKASEARERAGASLAKVSKPRAAVQRPAQAKPKKLAPPKAKALPKRKAPERATAFKKPHDGHKARAASNRGAKSHGRKIGKRR